MNCPNCGLKPLSDQQFCRSCGANLKADDPRPVNRRMLWGLIMAFGGILIALVGKMLLHQEIVTFIGVLASISGIFFIAAYPFLFPTRQNKRDIGFSQPEALTSAEPTNKLPPMNSIDYIPSVIEGTTDLLKVPAKNRSDTGR